MSCQPSKCVDCGVGAKACQLIGGRCSACHAIHVKK